MWGYAETYGRGYVDTNKVVMWGYAETYGRGYVDTNKVVMWGACGVLRDGAESNKVVMWGGRGRGGMPGLTRGVCRH